MRLLLKLSLALLFLSALAFSQTSVTADSFGFQCGIGLASNCKPVSGAVPAWPSSQAVGGMGFLRLWDSNIAWGELMKGYNAGTDTGTYAFTTWLDGWLDRIAAQQPLKVIYTIGWTPSFEGSGTCNARGCTSPPSDLGTGACGTGSCSFNRFITDLVNHCSPGTLPTGNHCFKDYVKYYEGWNEANASAFYGPGTQAQLYQLWAPAVAIIKANVTGAKILTPPISQAGGAAAYQSWFNAWQNQEISFGLISDIFSFHKYLNGADPETQISQFQNQLCLNNHTKFPVVGCTQPGGWATLPAWVTETSYNSSNETCTLAVADCAGIPARLHLILQSNGIAAINWYQWNTGIGGVATNSLDFYWMEQYLTGGTLNSACTSSGTPVIYQCSFAEADTTNSLWAWTTSTTASFTVPGNYTDFRDLHGGRTYVQPGQSISLTQEPILLELSPLPFPPSTPAPFID